MNPGFPRKTATAAACALLIGSWISASAATSAPLPPPSISVLDL